MENETSKLFRVVGGRLFLVLVLLAVPGCALFRPAANPALVQAADGGDALQLSDALEGLIDSGRDTTADRQFAYDQVIQLRNSTAADSFARAAITGRLVQTKGLLAAAQLPEVEENARRSRQLDPNFRDGAATRLLGTLYVMAPSKFLRHGNSETGIDLLEELTTKQPDVLENHLRLAEAYAALSDVGSAAPHVCACLPHKASLRNDDQQLLARLVEQVGTASCGK